MYLQPLRGVAFWQTGERERKRDAHTHTLRERCWRLRVRAGGEELGKEQQQAEKGKGARVCVRVAVGKNVGRRVIFVESSLFLAIHQLSFSFTRAYIPPPTAPPNQPSPLTSGGKSLSLCLCLKTRRCEGGSSLFPFAKAPPPPR